MTTEEIAQQLKLTAQLMELHEENPFKIKSIANAAFKLDKTDIALQGLSLQELEKIEGIGKGIASKINELQTTGTLKELSEMVTKTPVGVIDMLGIKGIGPKKVGQLWRELQIESVGELLYACNENRLISLKGFGTKTQEQVKKQIEFYQSNQGKFHFASLEDFANELVEIVKKKYKTELVSLTGEMRRKSEIIHKIEIVIATDQQVDVNALENKYGVELHIISCKPEDFYATLFRTTAHEEHLKQLGVSTVQQPASEKEIYQGYQLTYIEPELREGLNEIELARTNKLPRLIEFTDLCGILHNHSTYSDGIHSLKEMAEHCKKLGYEYLGICDHSQSAFYANGLKPDRVAEQQHEIDQLNEQLHPFKIFKGIESDILNDGSLDYPVDVLKTFDFIVASIHSNLKMNEEKATARIIKAIENPYTTILGHPTGRLLLSRAGYPIDHKKIIDACAANDVVIELNSHPYRLDIDWRWIPYCMEKGVKISINPDAHEKNGYNDMKYGTYVARKGRLTKEMCFNTLSREEMDVYFKNKKNRNSI
ncbi:MAG TPA: helix-hairpin-helix domain-containing protein [Bacteroidia bacterium]|nr:helix-hairpin-helix domain-containing protein [Bacteroidia bacterium]